MAVYQCERCGGSLLFTEGSSIAVCDSCGSRQSVPSEAEEKLKHLFIRANELRLRNAFDKAAGVYESILEDSPESAEAYWGLLLCEFGIEYVPDAQTSRRIPTCHRLSAEKITASLNYQLAIKYARQEETRALYMAEGEALEQLRANVALKARNAEPVDIFISYKESDDAGGRTPESAVAQKLYMRLCKEGWRVFYARESLKAHAGEMYEPYIFAALHSAKVMLVVASKRAHLEAPWVRNEWSRYMALMKSDAKQERRLIPCVTGMSIDDLPDAFLPFFQVLDLGAVGAEEDLVLGLTKFFRASTPVALQPPQGETNVPNALLTRAEIEVSVGNWGKAETLCDEALSKAPKCAEAYLVFLMVQHRVQTREALRDKAKNSLDVIEDRYFKGGLARFAQGALRTWVEQMIAEAKAAEAQRQKEADERAAWLRLRAEVKERVEKDLKCWRHFHWEAQMLARQMYAAPGIFAILSPQDEASVHLFNVRQKSGMRKTEVVGCASMGETSLFVTLEGALVDGNGRSLGQACRQAWGPVAVSRGKVYGLNGGTKLMVADWRSDGELSWQALASNQQTFVSLYAGKYGVVAVTSQRGSWLVTPEHPEGEAWESICSAAVGDDFVVGLKPFGQLVCKGRAIVPEAWQEEKIVGLASGGTFLLGLTQAGEVLVAGSASKALVKTVCSWCKCSAIAAGDDFVVAIQEDGTLLSTNGWLQKQLEREKLTFEELPKLADAIERHYEALQKERQAVFTKQTEVAQRYKKMTQELFNEAKMRARNRKGK